MSRAAAPYGSWPSPITAGLIGGDRLRLGAPLLDGDDLYWVEGRPTEGGRYVLVQRAADGSVRDVTPAPYNVRTRVHEYGGTAAAVHDGVVWFSNDSDRRLYRVDPGGVPGPITAESGWRYADLVVDAPRRRLLAVGELHEPGAGVRNMLVAVPVDGGEVTVLAEGADFYAAPRPSPDGARLAWYEWDNPDMPWDAGRLQLADMDDDGLPGAPVTLAGGPEESLFQPEWSPDGTLHVVSDRSGWWNLYRVIDGALEPVITGDMEIGLPLWNLGSSTYAFAPDGRLAFIATRDGSWTLYVKDPGEAIRRVETPFTAMGSHLLVAGGHAVLAAGGPGLAVALVRVDLGTGEVDVVRRTSRLEIDPRYLSTPEALDFPTADGTIAHAIFYPPHNGDITAPEGERPPLVVHSHGGPTAAATTELQADVQFWTSRGIAVLDVNYGGSTGYGRAYRSRLDGQWGIVDVDDCVAGARFLAERGDVDAARMAISGGSAGGFTTLAALTFRDVFTAGASHYGVADLEALARDTHKFEARYLDRLVGAWPEAEAVYRARSPVHHTDQLSCPVILLQGLEDEVVPPSQAEAMLAALRARHIPCAYLPFEGEQHGFRRAENVTRALEAELAFYGRIFGFEPADRIAPVPIENL